MPGIAVFSEEFRTAIDAWTDLHGFRAGEVLVSHPIQPLHDDEVRALADAAFDCGSWQSTDAREVSFA